MSEHQAHNETVHAVDHSHPDEHAHPSAWTYVIVAVVLSILTLAEIGVFFLNLPRAILAVSLAVLATGKFAFVVMYYMHLKFDSKLFTSMFMLGLLMAIAILTGLYLLFNVFHPISLPG